MRRRRSLSIRLGISINVWQASSLACFWLSDSGWYISRLRCFNVGFDALIALHKVFGCTLAVETILASCLLSRRAWLKDEKGMLTSDPRCLKPAAKISVATLICFSSSLEGAPVRWQSVVYLPSLNARFQRLRKAYDFAGMACPILCTRSCLAFLRLLSHLIMHSIAARRHLTGLAGPAKHISVSNNQIYDALVSASKKHHWHGCTTQVYHIISHASTILHAAASNRAKSHKKNLGKRDMAASIHRRVWDPSNVNCQQINIDPKVIIIIMKDEARLSCCTW